MSKIMQSALDPSCLMCLTPQGWWSPLRQGVVWPTGEATGTSYPEQLGLVTLTNVLNTGTHWHAVDRHALYHVATAADLRGYAGDLTLLAAVDIAESAAPASVKRYDLINQGAANIPLTQTVFSWHINYNPNGLLYLSFLISDGVRWYESDIPYSGEINQIRTIAVTINKTTMDYRWYINGAFAARATVARWGALNALPTAFSSVYVGYRSYRADFWPDNLPSIEYAAIFDRALTAEQIKYLSNRGEENHVLHPKNQRKRRVSPGISLLWCRVV